jgi:hypothetical protein
LILGWALEAYFETFSKKREVKMDFVLTQLLPIGVRGKIARDKLFITQNPFDRYQIKIAETSEELKQAFQLLNEFSLDGFKISPFNALPTTSVITLIKDGRIVAAVTVIKDNNYGLPADEFYDLSFFRKSLRVAQIGSIAILPEYRDQNGRYFLLLLKYIFQYIENYMYCDTVIFGAHSSLKLFLDEILFFEKIPDHFLLKAIAPQRLFRFAFLGDLHQKWQHKYLSRPKENNLSYFFDFCKEPQFVFPNRIFYKDHDPVLNLETMGLLFLKENSILAQMSEFEKTRLLQFYSRTPFFERLKNYCLVREDLHWPRQEVRHDVYNPAQVIGGTQMNSSTLKIFNVSEQGVSLKTFNKNDFEYLQGQSVLFLSMQIGVNRKVKLKLEPVRIEGDKSQIGCRIADNDSQWVNYIDFLKSDLMKLD